MRRHYRGTPVRERDAPVAQRRTLVTAGDGRPVTKTRFRPAIAGPIVGACASTTPPASPDRAAAGGPPPRRTTEQRTLPALTTRRPPSGGRGASCVLLRVTRPQEGNHEHLIFIQRTVDRRCSRATPAEPDQA